jgi:FkbM family methyltransferase
MKYAPAFLKHFVRNLFNRAGLDIVRKQPAPKPFIPYIQPYDLTYRSGNRQCRFDFWLANPDANQWYKEWFYAASNPTWELDEYVHLVQPGDRVLEIGCHHGFLTMMLAHLTGPSGFVLAVDANPENVLVAQAQLTLNQLTPFCKVLFGAGADQVGLLEFEWRTNSHAIVGSGGSSQGCHSYSVPAVTGDDLDREYGPFNVLKVDVEGFELAVLRGCGSLLARKPKLILELHPHFMKMYGYDATVAEVLRVIDAAGYEGTIVIRPNFHLSLPFHPDGIPQNEVSNVHLRPKVVMDG